jgi:hypothetical protein
MAGFSDKFPNEKVIFALGDTVTYKRGIEEIVITAVIEQIGDNSKIDELKTKAEFLKSALPFNPQRGDTIICRFNTYTVDSIMQNDDNFHRLIVR